MRVGEGAATTLALVIHELATNSVKCGALSSDEGTLDVSAALDGDDIEIVGMERGGPAVEPSKVNGYGSRLVARSITGQLNGAIDYAWEPEGLIVTLTMKVSKLAAATTSPGWKTSGAIPFLLNISAPSCVVWQRIVPLHPGARKRLSDESWLP